MVNAPAEQKKLPSWWSGGSVVYQIYPASFKDDNGDGYGDLRGIINKLGHIKSLGVDAIWICPHYKSPRVDEGLYVDTDIHEPFGTREDCQELIDAVHAHGMKIMFDLVVNHCSDQHAWFKESRSSKTNPKRDWFYWKPPRMIDGVRHPPNNWRSCFGGSVWEWDEHTQEYYLHYFCPEQPDLNWENPETRQAIYNDAIRYWLDRGVDGFRIDTVNMYSKYLDFPDAKVVAPETLWQPAGDFFSNGPRLQEFLREMRKETFSKYDCFTIGELPNTPSLEKILSYISTDAEALDCTILFDLADLDHRGGQYPLMGRNWALSQFKALTAFAQQLAEPEHKAHALTYLENHDQARSVTRYASDAPEHRLTSSKLLATYLLTLSGSIIIYEGQEIGMINAPKDWDIDTEYLDVNTINTWREIKHDAKVQNDPSLLERGRAGIQLTARDHARTPMQWDGSENAGFSSNPDAKPWYRVMESYAEGLNVAAQEDDPNSTLNFYRQLVSLRKAHKDLFILGRFQLLDPGNDQTMLFTKTALDGSQVAFVALNFSAEKQPFELPIELTARQNQLLISTLGKSSESRELDAYEARVYLA
ncbi:glycoside hydrolase family 13 protein [Rhodotorula paludigena]|uniref:glycoside hydrolase family 13 protein n=1 Tax=Rhodotorula paludigena TaxID=86838 RepID=UPI0031823AD2